MSKQEIPINEKIRAKEVRIIGENGEQFGVKTIEEARQLAEEAGADLVMVAPDATPPVVRVMDFGKFKYQQKKRMHEHHKHQPQLKELRLRPKTEEHDLMVRVRQARGFFERGDRVLVTVMFRGREMAHLDLGRAVLDRFVKAVEDVAKVEKAPMLEGRRLGVTLAKK